MKIFGEIKDKTDRKMRRIEKVILGVLAVVLAASLSIGTVAAVYLVSEVSIQIPEDEKPSATPKVADSIDPVLRRAKGAMPDYRPKDDKGLGQPEATPRVFRKNDGGTVTEYVLSSGVWLPVSIKEFDTAKEAEEYIAGQNDGPMAEPE